MCVSPSNGRSPSPFCVAHPSVAHPVLSSRALLWVAHPVLSSRALLWVAHSVLVLTCVPAAAAAIFNMDGLPIILGVFEVPVFVIPKVCDGSVDPTAPTGCLYTYTNVRWQVGIFSIMTLYVARTTLDAAGRRSRTLTPLSGPHALVQAGGVHPDYLGLSRRVPLWRHP